MADEAESPPTDALEDVAYLSRSENRVRILDELSRASWTRRDLCEETGVARATLDRIVSEFEDRGWARRTTDGDYVATPAGREAATETTAFLERMGTLRRLGDLVDWFRTDEGSVDLHHLASATVHRPTEADPTVTVERMTTLLRDADRFRCLVRVAPPAQFERAMRDGVAERDLTTEHVITDTELAAILDQPGRVRRWRAYLEAGATVYCYDGDIPCNVLVFDDVVVVGNSPSDIAPPFTVVESDDQAVREWATGLVETYRDRAERIDADTFPSEPSDSVTEDSG